MTDRTVWRRHGKWQRLMLLAPLALAACGPGDVAYPDQERASLMSSNLEARFGNAFWHRYLEDVSVDGTRAVAVTSNVLVSSRICFGLAVSAVDMDGRGIGVDTIEIRDTLGNATFDCEVED